MAKDATLAKLEQVVGTAVEWGRPIVHWGFIPAVIIVSD